MDCIAQLVIQAVDYQDTDAVMASDLGLDIIYMSMGVQALICIIMNVLCYIILLFPECLFFINWRCRVLVHKKLPIQYSIMEAAPIIMALASDAASYTIIVRIL